MKNRLNIHFTCVLLAAVLWGTAGIFVRTVETTPITEMQLVTLRALFSLFFIGVIILITGKKLFKIKLKDIWLFAAAGILSVAMFNFCYYKTMSLTSLSVAAVLMYTAPFFVMIMSVFIFKQPLTLKKCIACLTAFFGCCLVSGVFGSAQKISTAALFFGILTGFGYSLYTIFGRLLLDKGYNSLTITFYTFVFAFTACLFFIDIPETVSVFYLSPKGIITTVLMALINTVIPYLLYTSGLNGVDPSAAPVISTVEPVVATLIGAAVYKEKVTFPGVIGILLVLASVAILNVKAGDRSGTAENKSIRKNKSDSRGKKQAG